jgi:hypothetical protein
MAAGLRATAKAVEHPPEPKVGAPVLDPTERPLSRDLEAAVNWRLLAVRVSSRRRR